MSIAAKTMETKKLFEIMEVENLEGSEKEASDRTGDTGNLADDDSDSGNSSEDGRSNDSGADQEESKFMGNPGWANAMQKILRTNKPKKKKTLVLSRAKKISEVKPKGEKVPFEIEGEDGEINVKLVETEFGTDPKEVKAEKRTKREKMKHSIRVKPSPLNKPREKTLQKIATKGVVQLFNAVREQQQEIENKLMAAGSLEGKREKVLKSIDKRGFLDNLMGGTKSLTVDQPQIEPKHEEDATEKSNKVWSVLRDDFVMGANLKDWDKKAPEEEGDSSDPEEIDSD